MRPLFLEAMEGYNRRPADIIGYHLILTLKGGPRLEGLGKVLIIFHVMIQRRHFLQPSPPCRHIFSTIRGQF